MAIRERIQAFFNPDVAYLKRDLAAKTVTVQHLQNILSADAVVSTSGYVGNNYKSYAEQVKELDSKYRGCADWGNQIAATIVDVRAAFTIGQGVKAKLREGKEGETRTLDFITEFMELQDIDQEVPQSWAREAEIEGKFLCRLFPNEETKSVDTRFIPWVDQNYKIITPDDDYMDYLRAEYRVKKTGKEQIVPAEEFVYKKFGGRMHTVDDSPPKAGKILTAIENIDKALWDWRKINHYFASPTPYFECIDVQSAQAMQGQLEAINWKIGKALAGTGKFSLNSLDGSGISAVLKEEITTSVQVVCASVSLPPHFLGFPELMSNRSTSTDLFELIQSGTSAERKIWIGFYEELFQKVIDMANEEFGLGLDPEALEVDIPFVTAEKMKELVEVWLPMYTAGTLSLETFLSKVPEVDAEEEIERIEEAKEEAMQQAIDIADAGGNRPEEELETADAKANGSRFNGNGARAGA